MEEVYRRVRETLEHIEALNRVFTDLGSFKSTERIDFELYQQNKTDLSDTLTRLNFYDEIYSQKERRMILADFYEYIFLGRGYYSMDVRPAKRKTMRSDFVRAILHFVNLLMSYETITISDNLRRKVIKELADRIPKVKGEDKYKELASFGGAIAIGKGKSTASKELEKYFDSLLPKTAGGLWHELLVYIFLLRNNCGYILPLLLTQRFMSLEGQIVPPDFLIIAADKRMYGIEVGRKKEIQSGAFSVKTAIPTASIDTSNSRSSDRCLACNKWIQFCPHVISRYSDLDIQLGKPEVRCLQDCSIYRDATGNVDKEFIAKGGCPYTKYQRKPANKLTYTQHKYADTKLRHYHYQCVLTGLTSINPLMKQSLIDAQDTIALKTHFPYYSGIEGLMKEKSQSGGNQEDESDETTAIGEAEESTES